MLLDLTKPIQISDGRPARIICTDMARDDHERPVLVVLVRGNGHETAMLFTHDGEHFAGLGWPRMKAKTLVNVLVKHTRWVNMYRRTLTDACAEVALHLTKEEADKYSGSSRIACVEITFTEGDGL